MRAGKKEKLSPEQLRQNVDAVMAHWNDRKKYPEFAEFLDALMFANGNMDNTFLDHALKRLTEGKHDVQKLRSGFLQPSYQFIEHLLQTNLLNLDPERIKPANGNQPAGDQRVALFAKAELVEVTPESIAAFNRDVLAGVQRTIEAGRIPHWVDIAIKLFDFHRQGGRTSVANLQRTLGGRIGKETDEPRFIGIFNKITLPSLQEREGLYAFLQLTSSQARFLEDGLAQNKISSILRPAQATDFSRALDLILKDLKSKKISTMTLDGLSRDPVSGKPTVAFNSLSAWRLGKTTPTLVSFRHLISVLEKLEPGVLEQSRINDLISYSGFTREQLNCTAHEMVRNCNENAADIHALLLNIRSAKDVSATVEMASAAALEHGVKISAATLLACENNTPAFTSDENIRGLMAAYNDIITQNDGVALTADDIDKVVRINARCRAGWSEQAGKDKILGRRPADWRTIISARLENEEPLPAKF